MRPKLQIALDVLSIDAAKEILTSEVVRNIDIIEVGTLLLASEGKKQYKILENILVKTNYWLQILKLLMEQL